MLRGQDVLVLLWLATQRFATVQMRLPAALARSRPFAAMPCGGPQAPQDTVAVAKAHRSNTITATLSELA